MPAYDFSCQVCEHLFEHYLKIADRDTPQECPSCGSLETTRHVGAPMMMDPVRAGVKRPDNGFREVLHRIHEKNPGSVINKNQYF